MKSAQGSGQPFLSLVEWRYNDGIAGIGRMLELRSEDTISRTPSEIAKMGRGD